MILKNKEFLMLICFFLIGAGGLQSQDYVTDLRKANQLLSVAQERDRVAAEALEDVKSRRLRLEEDLAYGQENPSSISKNEKKKLETDIKTLRKKEEDLLLRRKYANNLLLDVTDILQASPKKRRNFISEYENRYGPIKQRENLDTQNVTKVNTQPVVELPKVVATVGEHKTTNKTTIKELENVSENPPEPFVGSDVISPEPATPIQKETNKKLKKEKRSPSKAVVKNEVNAKKEDTLPKSEKTNKKKSEPKAIPQNDIVIAEPKPDTRTRKQKDKTSPVVFTRPESSKTSVTYKKFDPKEDVMSNTPSTMDCHLAFDGMDNFTGKKKQETTPIILFAHTDDFMRPAMKGKDFVTCEATATRVEGSRIIYINLTMTIQTKEAQRTFGFLDRGALIIFRFINGKKIALATNKTDIGVVDANIGTTTFRAQLAVAEAVELTQSELDVIRVSWSVGYEDYEIFDMDVLRNLFRCLDKK